MDIVSSLIKDKTKILLQFLWINLNIEFLFNLLMYLISNFSTLDVIYFISPCGIMNLICSFVRQ